MFHDESCKSFYFGAGDHESQKHCRHGFLHSCERWLLLVDLTDVVMVLALDSRRKWTNASCCMSPVLDEERLRPDHWLGSVYFATVGWVTSGPCHLSIPRHSLPGQDNRTGPVKTKMVLVTAVFPTIYAAAGCLMVWFPQNCHSPKINGIPKMSLRQSRRANAIKC